jgi:hypothetical protein
LPVKPSGLAADKEAVTVSPPVRIVALVGLVVALAAGGLLALRMRHQTTAPPAATPAVTAPLTTPSAPMTHPRVPAQPVLRLDPGLPPPVRSALEHSRRAIVFVYSRSSATDLTLRTAVAEGAKEAGVPFVPLDVDSNAVAAAVFGWTSAAADPETLVVRRPGTVAFKLLGMTDSTPVAQAVASSR